MKKMVGLIGLLACSAGLFTLPAATRWSDNNRNNGNQVYNQGYAGGGAPSYNQGYAYNRSYNSGRDIRYRSAYLRRGDDRHERSDRDRHEREYRDMGRHYESDWR